MQLNTTLFEVIYREALQIIQLLGNRNWWKLFQHSKGSYLILWHCSVALTQGFMDLSGHSELLLSWAFVMSCLFSLYRETMRKAGTMWHQFWYSRRITKTLYFWQCSPLQAAGLPTSFPHSLYQNHCWWLWGNSSPGFLEASFLHRVFQKGQWCAKMHQFCLILLIYMTPPWSRSYGSVPIKGSALQCSFMILLLQLYSKIHLNLVHR